MRRLLLLAGGLAAAGALAEAREPKKPKAPAAPVLDERPLTDDLRIGEAMDEVCIADPPRHETIDGRDNLLVIATADGGEAVLQLSGCAFNTLMFASSFATKDGGCPGVGDALLVSAFGPPASCTIRQINRWRPERAHPLGPIEDGSQ